MEYIIGVDGGGTKTKAVAYNLEDKEIGKGRSGFGNLLLDFNKAAAHIINAIEQCAISIKADGGQGKCLAIYLGLAGIEANNNIEKIKTLLKEKFHCQILAFHDSQLAHAAILKGEDGIITISGTGSVSYGLYTG
ncbi:MAG: BadF/BadG/BcrA/BcrD ATPase family protein [Desulfitobacteriaceae bacterium]|nr:BadF/BadG/BcrA/BcrD ATPase family protein [Desulfitobacteriaceae bacterium]MDD4752499.1 BadF/BadG/BcrA/BcrD ATPase family protein [Desulfitobacteriaceae bacterium]